MNTILIVDDTPENLLLLSELLQPHYQVRAASSGRRALQVATTNPIPDLILLDVMMPEMDGYAVLAHLQADPRTASIPVIFVTALDRTSDEERGLKLGAVDYISKPIKPMIVLARVKAHIELKAARDLLQNRNATLEAEVAKRMQENLLIQDVSIRALAHLAEIRDPETGNHLRRTQAYINVLTQHLREHPRFADFLTEQNIQAMVKSAPLHDIGKVGIPDHILLKPGKLTPEEWEIMKTHSRLGRDAIEQAERDTDQPVEFLRMAKDIAHYHHEKWDGSGYPSGLVGEAIPISARLMALADVFDALIARRAYKAPFPFQKAATIICEGRDNHFDPAIVDAFQAEMDKFEAISVRHADSEADCLNKLEQVAGLQTGKSAERSG
ncbi:Response regulator receiver modulated metal dependent phosphohydrolase [Candidatus Competibacter denitrificans Run_A_D11]|uniref:Response regulator receiver modulated metal dependent phosphohydrolase n=1 Tax=Candidatus Competibacter denitrificans Run_A_D11 TaxID=1400863 RepID=W6MB92_9GAMM|nr:two-component system response regulator [Candidatus Competibacter denitrificans]CDI01158.1 Response regulator receiver modulated metal dependent phosphohydrolase [Candidatus Competibacter denitrificans Run_A_D11]HAS87634.1 two-component system response regulator [Candidatus Competibacteraceae bacterium]HRC69710.1 two-component system response regulator [Candidatus Competibacter denitrificans]